MRYLLAAALLTLLVSSAFAADPVKSTYPSEAPVSVSVAASQSLAWGAGDDFTWTFMGDVADSATKSRPFTAWANYNYYVTATPDLPSVAGVSWAWTFNDSTQGPCYRYAGNGVNDKLWVTASYNPLSGNGKVEGNGSFVLNLFVW